MRLAEVDLDPSATEPGTHRYYTAPQRADANRDAERARGVADFAERFPSPVALFGALQEAIDRAMIRADELRSTDNVRVDWGITVPAYEYIRTRLVEAGVHGFDIADALGVDDWIRCETLRDFTDCFRSFPARPGLPMGSAAFLP